MNLRLFRTVRLLVWRCTILKTSINSLYFRERLLLGRKCVQFKQFSPISQYLDAVRLETTFGLSGSSPKRDKIVGQIESGLIKFYCSFFHLFRLESNTKISPLANVPVDSSFVRLIHFCVQ